MATAVVNVESGMENTRHKMHSYWEKFNPTLESMMLDKSASIIHTDEQAEILNLLPNIAGKHVLELGAGIGRFTGRLASDAKNVTAVDFMQDYISTNRQLHGHLSNIKFIAADVLDLQLRQKACDVVFSNWLFMYLSDRECISLLQKILSWLADDGYLFIRESCFHSSGNMSRTTNPTFYRTPADYQSLLDAACNPQKYNHADGFETVRVGCIKSYIKHKNNSYQVYFLAKKIQKEMSTTDSFQQFLDQRQYSKKGVLRYEWIFGKTFLSTGGKTNTEKFISRLDLKPGQYVLDVGCGVGGHSFYMAENFNVQVLGIDLSVNMMTVATEHLSERPHLANKVKFVICDITNATYDESSFDVIYSRDTLLHIENKEQLFKNFMKWLKPGGKILFTDYTKAKEICSEDMEKYVDERGYYLLTKEQYKKLLIETGFINVDVTDKTEEFLSALHAELNKLKSQKENFLQEFSEADYNYLEEGWTSKIQRVSLGDQTWTACYGEKAAQ